jgi:predicted HAD superfamily phosphohydrolase YqeG
LQGAGYDIGSKFARGRISTTAIAVVGFGLTTDKMEAERAELIAIILNVAKMMHHIFRCIHKIRSRSIDEKLEHELETNREEERRKGIANEIFICFI